MIVREAHLRCHPEVVEMVAGVCGVEPTETWPVWVRRCDAQSRAIKGR